MNVISIMKQIFLHAICVLALSSTTSTNASEEKLTRTTTCYNLQEDTETLMESIRTASMLNDTQKNILPQTNIQHHYTIEAPFKILVANYHDSMDNRYIHVIYRNGTEATIHSNGNITLKYPSKKHPHLINYWEITPPFCISEELEKECYFHLIHIEKSLFRALVWPNGNGIAINDKGTINYYINVDEYNFSTHMIAQIHFILQEFHYYEHPSKRGDISPLLLTLKKTVDISLE